MTADSMKRLAAWGCLTLSAISAARLQAAEPAAQPAATPPAAGHSWHGETFNEGPRQRAYLMGSTGPVN